MRVFTEDNLLSENYTQTATALLNCTNVWYINVDRKMFSLWYSQPWNFIGETIVVWNRKWCISSDRHMHLREVNEIFSKERNVKCSVPQGTIFLGHFSFFSI